MEKTVTFLNRMRKSYSVTISDNIKFLNDRGCHVETPEENLTGKTFLLGARSEKMIGMNIAIMYDVVGLTNGNDVAHLTVYFGPTDLLRDQMHIKFISNQSIFCFF